MEQSLVTAEHLTKRFGTFTALDDCTLDVQRGEVFGLLGPNGAGKSTLLRLILGFLSPTSGRARMLGLDCHRERVATHRMISYLPGDPRLFRTMNGRQVLRFFAEVRRDGNYARALEIADRLQLDLSRWVPLMSTGMRQKLALAACLSIDTPLLILDEPTANLDPTVRGQILEMVLEAKRAGRTVIFSSHVLSEIEEVCDRVAILRKGRLVHMQCIRQLRQQHRIEATMNGEFFPPAGELGDGMEVTRLNDDHVQIDSPLELRTLLRWLSELPLHDIRIQPIGLRAVYDRFHSDPDEERS